MRSIPLVLVLFWFFFLMPNVLQCITGGERPPQIGAERTAIITFIMFEAAYFCEIMRAGIQSIPKGQVYPAYALGLTYGQAMRLVVLPQAFRNMIPVLLTQTIILFQDTSLVYVISATDFTGAASKIAQRDGRLVEMYLFVAVVYFVLCYHAVVRREAAAEEDRRHPLRANAMPMIAIDNVSKWYGQFQVLTDCTTKVEKGEVIVVCGPSGSGKSTLIKCVNALEPFQKGEIIVDGVSGRTIRRPTCRSCARASAWCSSTSSCSRTCRSPRT